MALVNPVALSATAHRVVLAIAEDGNALAPATIDLRALLIAAGITTGGFFGFLSIIYADQAAARLAGRGLMSINQRYTATADGGGGCFPVLLIDEDVSAPGVANNFRYTLTGVKANALDTASYIIEFEFRHSTVR